MLSVCGVIVIAEGAVATAATTWIGLLAPTILSASVAVTVTVPAATPVSAPVVGRIVAIAAWLVDQVYGALPPVAEKLTVWPICIVDAPPCTCTERTVMTAVVPVAPTLSRTVTVPLPADCPTALTLLPVVVGKVRTPGALELQV